MIDLYYDEPTQVRIGESQCGIAYKDFIIYSDSGKIEYITDLISECKSLDDVDTIITELSWNDLTPSIKPNYKPDIDDDRYSMEDMLSIDYYG